MKRTLLINAGLALLLCALLAVELAMERRREAARGADSTFHTLADRGSSPSDSVTRLDLSIRDHPQCWTYLREKDGWHTPNYRNAFALAQGLEGLIKSFLESRGTVVGRLPLGAEHFGLTQKDILKVSLYDAGGNLVLRAMGGRVAPGERSTECYMAAAGREEILQMQTNPWPYLDWKRESRFPPLVDFRVVPLAFGRPSPSRIMFGGQEPPPLKEIFRKTVGELPRPRYEWYGVPPEEPEKRLKDSPAFEYVGHVAGLAFDDLLGTRAELASELGWAETAGRKLTLQYDDKTEDLVILGPEKVEGLHYILNSSTGQVFLITAEKAKALAPDLAALLGGE